MVFIKNGKQRYNLEMIKRIELKLEEHSNIVTLLLEDVQDDIHYLDVDIYALMDYYRYTEGIVKEVIDQIIESVKLDINQYFYDRNIFEEIANVCEHGPNTMIYELDFEKFVLRFIENLTNFYWRAVEGKLSKEELEKLEAN